MAGALGARNRRHGRRIFRRHVTAAAVAEAVVHARATAVVYLGIDGGGPRKRMPAEPLRGIAHELREFRAAQRGHRVRAFARALEDVAARVDDTFDIAGLS